MQVIATRFVLVLLLCAGATGCAHTRTPVLQWDPELPSATLEGAVRVGAVRNLRASDFGADNPDLLGYSRSGPGFVPGKRNSGRPYLANESDASRQEDLQYIFVPETVAASFQRLVEGSLLASGIQAHSEHPTAEVSVDVKALWVDGYLVGFGADGDVDVVVSDLAGHELRRLPLRAKGSGGAWWAALQEMMNRLQKSMIAAFREPGVREALLEPEKVASKLPPSAKATPAGTPAPVGKTDRRARLKELKQMRDDGLITDEDYQKKKKEILDSM